MRALTDNELHLHIRHIPWVMWIFGAIFMAAGIGAGGAIGQVSTVECDRAAAVPNCVHRRSGIFGDRATPFNVADLRGARVHTSVDSDGDRTHSVRIKVGQDELAFTNYSTSGYSRHNAVATQINNFAGNPDQRRLDVKRDDRLWGLLFGGIFFLVGLAVAVGAGKIINVRFDVRRGVMEVTRWSMVLGRKREIVPLEDVKGADVEVSRSSKGGNTYRTSIMLMGTRTIPLTSYYSSGRRSKDAMANTIRHFVRKYRAEHLESSPSEKVDRLTPQAAEPPVVSEADLFPGLDEVDAVAAASSDDWEEQSYSW